MLRTVLFAAVLASFASLIPLAPFAPVSSAQELPSWNPDLGTRVDRRSSLGLDLGKPLVFGLTAGYRFDERTSARLGIAALGSFTALGAEARYDLTAFEMAVPVPFVAAGFTQYFLAVGPEKTSPIAFHGALGVEYVFLNFVGVGARLGWLEALGGSRAPSVDRYGISDDTGALYFTMSGRYLF